MLKKLTALAVAGFFGFKHGIFRDETNASRLFCVKRFGFEDCAIACVALVVLSGLF
jgi:hypothetical protein